MGNVESQKTAKRVPATTNIKALVTHAKDNKVFHGVCTILALRERARYRITSQALKLTMAKEGYYYSKAEIDEVMRFLASQDLGKLEKDDKGKIKGLINIRYTLQSIGIAAVHGGTTLEPYRQPRDLAALVATKAPASETRNTSFSVKGPPKEDQAAEQVSVRPGKRTKGKTPTSIMAVIDGKTVIIPLNSKITAEDIGNMILDLHSQTT